MIDKRELLEKAREKGLNLMIVEKDYVLGWLLFGFSRVPNLVFKGGTALSKIYFPRIWRLSEDLDFSLIKGKLEDNLENIETVFDEIRGKSGIELNLKSHYLANEYLQLKIQYQGLISRNWIKVDITMDDLVEKPALRSIHREYSDYIPFKIRVETLEELFASKLRAVIERKKCRDYFDLWQLSKIEFDTQRIRSIFTEKCKIKKIEHEGINQIFPDNLFEIIKPYWERELGRLINPTPEMKVVINDLERSLKFIA
ncbi:MAG: nucleotidyl transferase AbiEii/AbiGii toxin family protein [Candidatus Lokiarchaeia archaeon]